MRCVFLISVLFAVVAFLVYKAWEIPDPAIEGFVAEGFEELRAAYREVFLRKLDKGSAFAAFHEGRLVAHLWAGCKDFFCFEPWQEDTTALMHSTTKFLGSLALAIMADRGRLNYSERVSAYWPEFAANGKAEVTVEQLLSHQAGVVGIEPPLTFDQLEEGGALIAERLANQEPDWPPGTQMVYHGLTIGLYMDELFRRVHPERKGIVEFLDKEVIEPLKLDIKIGLHDAGQQRRLAAPHLLTHLRLIWAAFSNATAPLKILKTVFLVPNATYRKITSPFVGTVMGHDFFRTRYIRLPLLSGNGIASVRSVAHLMGLVAISGRAKEDVPFPRQLLSSPRLLEKLQEPLGQQLAWMSDTGNLFMGRGHALVRSPAGSWMLGAPGMGGQMGFADPAWQIGWAFLTNHMSPFNGGDDPRHLILQEALYRCVGRLKENADGPK